jgi:hypothetical protein
MGAEHTEPPPGADEEEPGMVVESRNPVAEPRRRSRVEVWLFIAISLVGLLGFMSSLSTGDAQGVAGGEEPRAAAYAQP